MKATRLMAFSQTVGLIAWVIVPWFWVIIADPDVFKDQAEGVRTMANICWNSMFNTRNFTCYIL